MPQLEHQHHRTTHQPPGVDAEIVTETRPVAANAAASGSGASTSHTRTTASSGGGESSSDSNPTNNRSSGDDDRAGSSSNSGADDHGHLLSVTVGFGHGVPPPPRPTAPGGSAAGRAEAAAAAVGSPIPIVAERFKTKRCKKFEQTGHCPYLGKCMFAHGERELRTMEQNMEEGIVSQIAVYSLRRRMAKSKADGDEAPPAAMDAHADQPDRNAAAGNKEPAVSSAAAAAAAAAAYGANTVAGPVAPPPQPHWQQYHNHHAFPAAPPQLYAPGTGMYPPAMMMMPPMLPMPQPFLPVSSSQPSPVAQLPPASAHMSHHHYHAHHALPHTGGMWPPPFGPYGTALPSPPHLAMPVPGTSSSSLQQQSHTNNANGS